MGAEGTPGRAGETGPHGTTGMRAGLGSPSPAALPSIRHASKTPLDPAESPTKQSQEARGRRNALGAGRRLA